MAQFSKQSRWKNQHWYWLCSDYNPASYKYRIKNVLLNCIVYSCVVKLFNSIETLLHMSLEMSMDQKCYISRHIGNLLWTCGINPKDPDFLWPSGCVTDYLRYLLKVMLTFDSSSPKSNRKLMCLFVSFVRVGTAAVWNLDWNLGSRCNPPAFIIAHECQLTTIKLPRMAPFDSHERF